MLTVIQRSHTVLLPPLHLLSSGPTDQQTEPEVKAPQCQAIFVRSLLSLLCRGHKQSMVRPLEKDVAQRELRPFPPLKTAVLQPRALLWKALDLGLTNI